VQEHHPRLLLLQATLALGEGQHALALDLLAKAEAFAPDTAEVEKREFQAMVVIQRSKALFQAGEYLQAQMLCQQILLHAPEQKSALRAAVAMRLGVCASLQGDFPAGITYLQQSLCMWAHQPPLNQAIEIHGALANTYYLTGNFLLAQHHLAHMLGACDHLQDISGKMNTLILQGLIFQDQDRAAEAEAIFLQALALARVAPYAQRGEAYALVNLGSFSVEQGKYVQALTYSEDGLALARKFGNRSLINAALSNLALSYLFLGDSTSALLTVEQMEAQALSAAMVGYERVWRELTSGLILLKQQRYPEATTCLREVEAALQTTDMKRGHLQAKLRLASCWVAQDHLELALHLLEEGASLLAVHRSYIHLVQIELQWLPDLLPVVQNHPQLAPLRALLGIVEPPQPQNGQDASSVSSLLAEVRSSRLTIYAFGEPAVLLNEQPIKRWRMAHAMELFFFLLDCDHPISKETILTALWPEYGERTSHIFHDTVYQLRKLLGEASVVFRSTGYRLDLAACYGEQVWYDVQVFQQHQIEAEQALARENETLAKEALLKMVQLYRGDYGRSFYSDWCIFRRDDLRTVYLEARRQLAQIAWRAEAWSESANHWRQMLRLDACLEEAHYGLMRCYVRQGKRDTALRQYHSCKNILAKELGVQPGPAIQNLYQRLTATQSAE
jgi:two-component SAPR family response regulator